MLFAPIKATRGPIAKSVPQFNDQRAGPSLALPMTPRSGPLQERISTSKPCFSLLGSVPVELEAKGSWLSILLRTHHFPYSLVLTVDAPIRLGNPCSSPVVVAWKDLAFSRARKAFASFGMSFGPIGSNITFTLAK